MTCAYGDPENRPTNKSLCAKGRQKRGLPLGGDPNRPIQKDTYISPKKRQQKISSASEDPHASLRKERRTAE